MFVQFKTVKKGLFFPLCYNWDYRFWVGRLMSGMTRRFLMEDCGGTNITPGKGIVEDVWTKKDSQLYYFCYRCCLASNGLNTAFEVYLDSLPFFAFLFFPIISFSSLSFFFSCFCKKYVAIFFHVIFGV